MKSEWRWVFSEKKKSSIFYYFLRISLSLSFSLPLSHPFFLSSVCLYYLVNEKNSPYYYRYSRGVLLGRSAVLEIFLFLVPLFLKTSSLTLTSSSSSSSSRSIRTNFKCFLDTVNIDRLWRRLLLSVLYNIYSRCPEAF